MERFSEEYLINKNFLSLLFAVFYLPAIIGQKSIQPSDIEIHTQLTFLSVLSEDVNAFEKGMGELSSLSKSVQLDEKYDWLTYKSDNDRYLVVNFSNGPEDVLTINDYRNAFDAKGSGKAFETILQSIQGLGILAEKNYIIQMLLPWSTAEAISVSEFPLATMVEYSISTHNIEQFDVAMRQLTALLKKTKYPYPLESNRGHVGAYGTMALVWFYDSRSDYLGKNNLLHWMEKHRASKELQAIMNKIERISESTRTYHLDYKKLLSF
jgi:hypothetical protein